MKNPRKYGYPPYKVALLHGGPGAPGEMAPVAKQLSKVCGVLEPFQTKATIEGQILELHTILKDNVGLPIILIGWSWGAWLGFIFAARYPAFVKKLILISSGPFEEKYAQKIMETRLQRHNFHEKKQVLSLKKKLEDKSVKNKNPLLKKFGKLIAKADTYNPIASYEKPIKCQYEIFQKVWQEASTLRKQGKLLDLTNKIKCPILAIHGDYDPHPAQGVKQPLGARLKNFKFILLEKCGHKPWVEKEAQKKFFQIIKQEIC